MTPVFYIPSLDLIMLVIAVAVGAVLGIAVYMSDPRSATHRIFALLTFSTMCWLVITYVVRLPTLIPDSLILHRLGIFFAAPMSSLFFLFAATMPSRRITLSRTVFWAVVGATVLMMALNISPYAFTGYTVVNGASEPTPGVGLAPFSVLSTLFSLLTIYWLIRSYRRASGPERKQIGIVLRGIIAMLALVTLTILVPVVAYGSIGLLAFTPVYALAFLGVAAYAITEYQLFNIKVLVTQSLTLVLCIVLFAKLFGEPTLDAQITDGFVLAAVIIFGFFLVRSVRREVEQRERIEQLATELTLTNARQETLIHFIGHEVKGFLTKAQGSFAALSEGDFGKLPEDLQPFVKEALRQTRDGVTSVSDILQASNLKKGTVAFKKEPLDLAKVVEKAVESARPSAEEKKLDFSYQQVGDGYPLTGDAQELGDHVFRNLLDNAIAYTPSGSVKMFLTKDAGKYVFTITDTGVGISAEDMPHLFTEGGHGKESQKVNVHSTGYGLFIAKNVVEAHGGKIHAESDGPSKGSTFVVELPS